jgi:hypothetical protein
LAAANSHYCRIIEKLRAEISHFKRHHPSGSVTEAALDSYGERQRKFAPSPHTAQGIAMALHALQRLVEADAAYVRLREKPAK